MDAPKLQLASEQCIFTSDYDKERLILNGQHRRLTDGVKAWKHCNPHSYAHIFNLLIKHSTGITISQFKRERLVSTGKPMVDYLNVTELSHYNKLVSIVITCLSMETSYEIIKSTLELLSFHTVYA
jgi:hypothetical protein